jgi:hypothetical protein
MDNNNNNNMQAGGGSGQYKIKVLVLSFLADELPAPLRASATHCMHPLAVIGAGVLEPGQKE